MKIRISDTAHADAIDWHVRLAHGDGAAWDLFTVWLEADATHGAAYDAVEAADAEVVPLLPPTRNPLIVLVPVRRRTRGWVAWGGAAAAAAAVAVVTVWTVEPETRRYAIATAPGEMRIVAIDGATQVTLNGATRLTLDHANLRFAALESGEALFKVRHDPAAPFIVEVGEDRIQDAGTVFNVVRRAGELQVAVAEGEIVYNPDREAVRLRPGQSLVDGTSKEPIVIANVAADTVGTWRLGRLSYAAEPLARVAADLERSLGTRIAVARTLTARRFSGTIVFDRSGPSQLTRLGPVLGVELHSEGDGWTMRPVDSAPH